MTGNTGLAGETPLTCLNLGLMFAGRLRGSTTSCGMCSSNDGHFTASGERRSDRNVRHDRKHRSCR